MRSVANCYTPFTLPLRSAHLSRRGGGGGGGSTQRVRVSTSLFAVLDHITRVRLELRLLDLVQFAITSILLHLLVTASSRLRSTLLLIITGGQKICRKATPEEASPKIAISLV